MHHRLVTVSTDKVFPKLARCLIRKFPIYLHALPAVRGLASGGTPLRELWYAKVTSAGGSKALPRPTEQVSQPVPPPAGFCWSTGISEASENHSLFCSKDNSSINSTSSEAFERKLQHFLIKKKIQNHGGFAYCRKLFCWKFGHLIVERSETVMKDNTISLFCALTGWLEKWIHPNKMMMMMANWYWAWKKRLRSTIQTYEGSIELQ